MPCATMVTVLLILFHDIVMMPDLTS